MTKGKHVLIKTNKLSNKPNKSLGISISSYYFILAITLKEMRPEVNDDHRPSDGRLLLGQKFRNNH